MSSQVRHHLSGLWILSCLFTCFNIRQTLRFKNWKPSEQAAWMEEQGLRGDILKKPILDQPHGSVLSPSESPSLLPLRGHKQI